MTRIRLLPVVVAAAGALLLLKTAGLVTEGRFALSGTTPAAAAGGHDPAPAEDHGDAGGHAGAETLATPATLTTERPAEAPPPLPVSEAERTILEQLAERRRQLDARQAEIDDRAALLEAAEQRILARIAELRSLEQELQATAVAEEGKVDAQLLAVVSMYESMRARDAAAIFDGMDAEVLTGLARHMKPRLLAAVMAEMEPTVAQRLTVDLATAGDQPVVPDFADLPKIGETIGTPR